MEGLFCKYRSIVEIVVIAALLDDDGAIVVTMAGTHEADIDVAIATAPVAAMIPTDVQPAIVMPMPLGLDDDPFLSPGGVSYREGDRNRRKRGERYGDFAHDVPLCSLPWTKRRTIWSGSNNLAEQ
jgi:hypothetical protein